MSNRPLKVVPTAHERARISVLTRCNDKTIKAVFDDLNGVPVKHKLRDASRERVLSGAREIGLLIPSSTDAKVTPIRTVHDHDGEPDLAS